MQTYNTVIVGGGASGMLAAIELDDKKSLLVEKNSQLGRKILITGGGRCNITNKAPIKEFVRNYNGNGNYYRGAFNQFFNDDIIKLLEDNGCKTKIEKKKQVFPTTDDAKDVNDTLISLIKKSNTKYKLNCNITDITKEDDYFILKTSSNETFKAANVILATGSDVYKNTGSNGDGERFATKLGHTKPGDIVGLAPVATKEGWTYKLQGIAVDVKIEIKADKKSLIKDDNASIMFTHNGLSGHIILDSSMQINEMLNKDKKVTIHLDFAGNLNYEQLDMKLQEDFSQYKKQGLKRYLHTYMPRNMVEVFLEHLDIEPDTILNQVTKKQRNKLKDALKNTILTVESVLKKQAMVKDSGIAQSEIDPNSFESKIVENLYITGELVEGSGKCGGFNLQKAFSTGVVAARTIKERMM